MRKTLIALSLLSVFSCANDESSTPEVEESIIPTEGPDSPLSYPNMTLVWQEEFEGNSLNLDSWTYEIGTGQNGWGNNELQYYTDDNTSMIEGNLVITAKKESLSGREYTSSRIITENKHSFQYGRIDVRAALPQGQGMWPAIWMLGSNFRTVGWPSCGEIDIMEMVGGAGRENTVHGTAHWSNNGSHAEFGGSRTLPFGDFHNVYHVFSIIWTDSSIKWYVDNQEYHAMDTTPAELDEFRNEFFFIMNLAVGGNWPGPPNSFTSFPQHLIVDYIRVFRQN